VNPCVHQASAANVGKLTFPNPKGVGAKTRLDLLRYAPIEQSFDQVRGVHVLTQKIVGELVRVTSMSWTALPVWIWWCRV
jgi:hypothetical protein